MDQEGCGQILGMETAALLFSATESSSGTLLALSQGSPSPHFPLSDPSDLGKGLGTAQSF